MSLCHPRESGDLYKYMIPIIIESDDQEKIDQYLSERYYLQNLVSQVKPENDSIGLAAIRFLIDRARFCPGQKQAVFLIRNGHLATPAGQNALLKTLEESLPEQQFIITTHNQHLLLPTIVSRCQVIHLISQKTPDHLNLNLLKDFADTTCTIAKSLAKSEAALGSVPKVYLKALIEDLRTANRHLPTPKKAAVIRCTTICLSDLQRNVNPRLALDHFFLKSSQIIRKPA